MKKYWKQIRPILPLVLIMAAIMIGLGILVTWLTPGGLSDRSFYLNIGATLIGLGVSIIVISFLLPTLLDMLSLRRIRAVEERLLDRFEEALISWAINFSMLMKCPDNLLRQLHPAMFGLPDKPFTERLPRDFEPELVKWFNGLRLAEAQQSYVGFKPQEWQTVIMNIWGLKWRMEYFRQQFLPISTSLPEISELSFKLIELLDNLSIIPTTDQPFKQNMTPVLCHEISIIGERLLQLLNDTREILAKTR
jgi:hypothetical protein